MLVPTFSWLLLWALLLSSVGAVRRDDWVGRARPSDTGRRPDLASSLHIPPRAASRDVTAAVTQTEDPDSNSRPLPVAAARGGELMEGWAGTELIEQDSALASPSDVVMPGHHVAKSSVQPATTASQLETKTEEEEDEGDEPAEGELPEPGDPADSRRPKIADPRAPVLPGVGTAGESAIEKLMAGWSFDGPPKGMHRVYTTKIVIGRAIPPSVAPTSSAPTEPPTLSPTPEPTLAPTSPTNEPAVLSSSPPPTEESTGGVGGGGPDWDGPDAAAAAQAGGGDAVPEAAAVAQASSSKPAQEAAEGARANTTKPTTNTSVSSPENTAPAQVGGAAPHPGYSSPTSTTSPSSSSSSSVSSSASAAASRPHPPDLPIIPELYPVGHKRDGSGGDEDMESTGEVTEAEDRGGPGGVLEEGEQDPTSPPRCCCCKDAVPTVVVVETPAPAPPQQTCCELQDNNNEVVEQAEEAEPEDEQQQGVPQGVEVEGEDRQPPVAHAIVPGLERPTVLPPQGSTGHVKPDLYPEGFQISELLSLPPQLPALPNFDRPTEARALAAVSTVATEHQPSSFHQPSSPATGQVSDAQARVSRLQSALLGNRRLGA